MQPYPLHNSYTGKYFGESNYTMITMKKIMSKKRFYLFLLLIGIFIFTFDFLKMRMSNEALFQHLKSNPFGYEAKINYHIEDNAQIRYVEIGSDSLPLVVFVHGAPSSSAFWRDFLVDSTLLSNAKLLAVDRPGYGYSNFGRPETSVQRQAELISKVIRSKRKQHQQIIVHGSSYGGTLCARLAMDYPELVDGMLLQSASVAPGKEKTYSISYWTSHWTLSWAVPGALHVANNEKLSHERELNHMQPLWDNIKSATIVLHGLADSLIYPENALFAKEKLVNASFLDVQMLKDRGHDLLWTQPNLLKISILRLIDITKQKLVFRESESNPYE